MKLKQIQGFSLTELMIVMAISLLVFSGVIGLFIASDDTLDDALQRGEMQENGRLALSFIAQDIMMSGYWGRYSGKPIHLISGAESGSVRLDQVDGNTLAVSGTDCIGEGENNGTFFIEDSDFYFRHLWGMKVQSSSIYAGCITDAKTGSDSIQIKRAIGQEVVAGSEDSRRIYFISNANQGIFYAGSDPTPALAEGLICEYQHHLYYVTEESRGDILVPVLKRKYLYKADDALTHQARMRVASLVEGVEHLGFLYGVDTDLDGAVNFYESAANLTRAHWEQDGGQIVAVRVAILIRALQPSAGVNNTNQYDLGSYQVEVNDNYRRLLFTQTVKILNSGEKVWRS
ncbi:PilW family protein [Catenovulum sp. 2E275]|uniref:PilW family protein n=1 Tax=Catenovulum sp. 2E275 TaxID=2980497 RepID=UPI0021CE2C5F|nr:PilW family protein [Catenovulum sp. 2E275]MCU4676281.1 PilW family protein [Catenovulum sp. 2E275]